jgi:hypothetical protein
MSLAICICTMNRPDELTAARPSLVEGSVLPGQIIVSDDGDGGGGGAEVVAREFESVLYQVGPRRRLGANRNACIAAATTDRIAFVDDGVLVSPDSTGRARAASLTAVTTGWELKHSTDPARKVTPHNASFLGFQRLEPVPVRRSIVITPPCSPQPSSSGRSSTNASGTAMKRSISRVMLLTWGGRSDTTTTCTFDTSPRRRTGRATQAS